MKLRIIKSYDKYYVQEEVKYKPFFTPWKQKFTWIPCRRVEIAHLINTYIHSETLSTKSAELKKIWDGDWDLAFKKIEDAEKFIRLYSTLYEQNLRDATKANRELIGVYESKDEAFIEKL